MMRNLITSQVQEMTKGIRTDISVVTHDLYRKMHELDKAYGKLPASYIPRSSKGAHKDQRHTSTTAGQARTRSGPSPSETCPSQRSTQAVTNPRTS